MAFRAKRDPELKGTDKGDCKFGDWLALYTPKTPITFIDLAYHAHDARLMAEMAQVIGKKDRAGHYRAHETLRTLDALLQRAVPEAYDRHQLGPHEGTDRRSFHQAAGQDNLLVPAHATHVEWPDGAVSVDVLPHGFGDIGHRRQNTLRAMYTTGECGREGMHGARGTRA